MTVVSMNYLLEAGVHFGHQRKRWNPKMAEYIYTCRDDIHIIDLQKTSALIEEAYEKIKEIATNGGTFLFVGTKKQANEAMEEAAKRTEMFYITKRWLGGTLTNFRTIRGRIKRIEEIEAMEADGILDLLPKKEAFKIRKEYDKLNSNLCGIREMKKLPSGIIIVDPRVEETAIKEARILNIPVFGIVDTNCDPDMVDYVIPANDDAVRAVKLVINVLANAIAEATGKEVINYISEEDKSKDDSQEDLTMEKVEETLEVKEVEEEKTKKVAKKEEVKEEKAAKKETKKEVKEEKPKKEAKKTAKKEEKIELDSLTLAELKAMAKENGIKGYSTMKKADLIAALK